MNIHKHSHVDDRRRESDCARQRKCMFNYTPFTQTSWDLTYMYILTDKRWQTEHKTSTINERYTARHCRSTESSQALQASINTCCFLRCGDENARDNNSAKSRTRHLLYN